MADDPTASVEIEIRVRMEALEKDLAEVKSMLEAFNNSAKDTATAFEQLEQRFNTSAQKLSEYNKNMKVVNEALASGSVSTKRAADVQTELALKYGQATIAQQLFAQTQKGVSNQLTAIAGGAGAVGTFLAGLGPWGLAAAVGLGAVAEAFHYIDSEARRMGDRAIDIKHFTDVTGLTVVQLKAMKDAATEMGISSDGVQSSFERLVRLMEGANRAAGPLYDQLRLGNPILAQQISETDDYAKRIDLLAQAYVKAASAGERARIAQAAFGRGGASQGPLLEAVARRPGGVAGAKENQALEEQTKRWADLKIKIDDMQSSTKNLFASIFTETGLQAAYKSAEAMQAVAKEAANLANLEPNLQWWQSWLLKIDVLLDGNAERLKKTVEYWKEIAQAQRDQEGRDALKAAMPPEPRTGVNRVLAGIDRALGTEVKRPTLEGTNLAADPAALLSWQVWIDVQRKAADAADNTAKSIRALQDAASRTSKSLNDQNTFIGSGTTLFEQLRAKLAAVNTAYLDHNTGIRAVTDATGKVTEADQAAYDAAEKVAKARAENAVILDALVQRLSTYTSALGAAASTEKIVAEKNAQLEQKRIQLMGGVDQLTNAQIANRKRLNQMEADGTYALTQQVNALRLQAGAIGMGVGAAETFRIVQGKMFQNMLDGKDRMADISAAFLKLAGDAGKLKESIALDTAALDANFERQTFGLTEIEKQIAAVGKSIYNVDWQRFSSSATASLMRVNDAFKKLSDMSTAFISGYFTDISHGVTATEALHNALVRLSDTLIQMASKQLVEAAIGGLAKAATTGVKTAGDVTTGGVEGAVKGGAEAAGGAATSAEMVAAGAAAGDAIAAGAITGAGALNGAAVEMDALLGPMFATAASGLAGAGLELELLGPMFATVSTGLTGASFELGTASAGLTASAAALTSAAAALAAANVGKAAVGVLHSGGVIGESAGATRAVNPAIFAGAPRFHGGGVVGDEVPIIAKKGERVQTKEQQRADKGGGGQDQSPQISLTQHNTFIGADPASEARLRQALEKTKNLAVAEAVSAVIKQRSNNPNMFR